MRPRVLAISGALVGAGLMASLGLASRGVPAASARSLAQRAELDDTSAVVRLLGAVRGANPLACELATRMADGRNFWSSGSGGDMIAMDSAASALIHWVHDREHRDQRVVPRLAAGLRDADRCVQRVSAAVLAHVDHPSAGATLLAALDDGDTGIRAAAAVGLGLAESKTAVQPLIRRLKDASADVRRSAAWALGAIEDKAAMDALIEALERDADAGVRRAAAWALGEILG
jgi:hypothetical protein